ncbi:MAG: D-glycero-beta-D-manno-heptose 1,7-bisphosphate 7-phosphatase [Helicobacteraceae bacterium]|nr:D-glycero-beta-D-manno-heptose 1,7-bisphosphate 7-phosphatase [Helicobacteraceae bacterium]
MSQQTKALFLDRDGVINKEINYLHKIEDFIFIDGIFELCKKFKTDGYKIFVVTNQSGICREYYSEDDFRTLTKWMVEEFKKNSIKIEKVYHCPHHPKFSGECECRKPNAGMLLQAEKEFNIDLKNSIIIGDKESDIEAGLNAGLSKTYLFDEFKKSNSSKATKVIHSLKELLSK